MVSRRRESLAGRIDLLIQAMDRLGVRLERASRGPSLATGPAKRMMAASENEAATDIAAAPSEPPAWRKACVFDFCEDGDCDVVSPTGKFWLSHSGWRPFDSTKLRGKRGYFIVRNSHNRDASEALDACDTPPPDWTAPDTAEASVNKNAILNTVAADSSQTATVSAPEDVIDPSRAAPGRVWYGGPTTEDVQEHRLCVIPPERSSYIRPTGTPGKYDQVWYDGSVTPSAFSDGGLNQCLKSPGWSMAYEPTARVAIGLPPLSELDHCREGGAL